MTILAVRISQPPVTHMCKIGHRAILRPPHRLTDRCAIQNQGTPSCLGATSSGLVWPRLALPCHALSCLVLSCLGLNVTLFRKYKKWDSYGGVVLVRFFTLFTIWLITVDNHIGKNIDIYWYFEQKTSFYKRYLLMAWYPVYPMILGHFQNTRLMPGKYGGHSAADILKLNLFIKTLYSGQWKLFHSKWAGHYIRDTR